VSEQCPKCGFIGPEEDGRYCRKCGMSCAGTLQEQLAEARNEIARLQAQLLAAPSGTALQNRLKRRNAGQNRTRKLKKQLYTLLQCGSNGRIIEEVTRLLARCVRLEDLAGVIQKRMPLLKQVAQLLPRGPECGDLTELNTILEPLLAEEYGDTTRVLRQLCEEVPHLRNTTRALRMIIKRLVDLCRYVGPPKPDHVCGAESNCDMGCAAYVAWEEILCECEDAAKVVPFDQRPKKKEPTDEY